MSSQNLLDLDHPPHGMKGLAIYDSIPYLLVWIVLGLILGVILSLAGWWLWKKRKKTLLPEISWDTKLEQKIKALTWITPFEAQEQSDFFYELNTLLKQYLEHSYGFSATDLTTRELKNQLRRWLQDLPQESVESMIVFFERSDLIKFAKEPSSIDEAKRYSDCVNTWIEQIKLRRVSLKHGAVR
jgi:hypothetical protein